MKSKNTLIQGESTKPGVNRRRTALAVTSLKISITLSFLMAVIFLMTHGSLAWVWVPPPPPATPHDDTEYMSAELQGPKQYMLPPRESASVTVLARPVGIRRLSDNKAMPPGVFEIIVSSPTANGVVEDKMPVTVSQAVTTPPADSATLSGVVTIEMKPDNGQPVNLTLPADMRPGDTISFSADTQDTATLSGAVLDIGGKEYQLRDKMLTFVVPLLAEVALPVILKDRSGREIARKHIPINKNATSALPGNVPPPRIGQTGQIVSIPGKFDGIADNTHAAFTPNAPQSAQTNVPVVAKSPRGTFVKIPSNAPTGAGTMTIQEKGVPQHFKFNVLNVKLSADTLQLKRGETTPLAVIMSGGEGLVEGNYQVTLDLTNLSPSVVRFKSTSSDNITAKVTFNNKGVATFNETLTGVGAGAFTIRALLKGVLGDEPSTPRDWVRKIAELKRKAANQSANTQNQKALRKNAGDLDKTADNDKNWDKFGQPKDKEKFRKVLKKEKEDLDKMQKRETKDSEAWKKIGEAKDAVDKGDPVTDDRNKTTAPSKELPPPPLPPTSTPSPAPTEEFFDYNSETNTWEPTDTLPALTDECVVLRKEVFIKETGYHATVEARTPTIKHSVWGTAKELGWGHLFISNTSHAGINNLAQIVNAGNTASIVILDNGWTNLAGIKAKEHPTATELQLSSFINYDVGVLVEGSPGNTRVTLDVEVSLNGTITPTGLISGGQSVDGRVDVLNALFLRGNAFPGVPLAKPRSASFSFVVPCDKVTEVGKGWFGAGYLDWGPSVSYAGSLKATYKVR